MIRNMKLSATVAITAILTLEGVDKKNKQLSAGSRNVSDQKGAFEQIRGELTWHNPEIDTCYTFDTFGDDLTRTAAMPSMAFVATIL